jgi:hypothetical protein
VDFRGRCALKEEGMNTTATGSKRLWIRGVGLSLFGFAGGGLFGWMFSGGFDFLWPRPRLIIEEEHAGIWMPIDNGFYVHQNPGPERRAGILLQAGNAWGGDWNASGGTPQYNDALFSFKSVDVVGTSTLSFALERPSPTSPMIEFDWMNIVSEFGKNTDPLPVDEAYRLFRWQSSQDCPIEDCITSTDIPTTAIDESKARPGCTQNLGRLFVQKDVAYSCLRGRSLSGWFTPRGMITYWHGPAGYGLQTSPIAEKPSHDRQEFRLQDGIRKIEIWKDKALKVCIPGTTALAAVCPAGVLRDLGTVTIVRVHHPSGVTINHGETHKTPTDH